MMHRTGVGRTLGRMWRRAPMLSIVAAGAALLALVFALRFGFAVWHWVTLPVDPELAGWMTPRFVAHAWDLPPDVILDSLALEKDGSGRRITLEDVAQMRSTPLPLLLDHVQAAIDAHRAGRAP